MENTLRFLGGHLSPGTLNIHVELGSIKFITQNKTQPLSLTSLRRRQVSKPTDYYMVSSRRRSFLNQWIWQQVQIQKWYIGIILH